MCAMLHALHVVLPLFLVLVLASPTRAQYRFWKPEDFKFVTARTSLGGECGPRASIMPALHSNWIRRRYFDLPGRPGDLLW